MVTYLSTNCDPTQQRMVQRRQKDGTWQDLPASVTLKLYKTFMFGTDMDNQNTQHPEKQRNGTNTSLDCVLM